MPLSGTAYCVTTDVYQAMSGLNTQGTPADINPAIVQQAIEQASARVSAWTGQIWGFDSSGNAVVVPDIIVSITIDIAAYYSTLAYRKNKPLEVTDPVVLRYNAALLDLKAIQEGEINPSPEQLNEPVSAPGRVINTVAPTLSFRDAGVHLGSSGSVEPDTFTEGGEAGKLGYY
jgi:phage gp36-like protein